ncbi:MAG TPA: ATP-binding protein, partial [Candidatus Bathyarchaeia archaeon]
MIHHEYIEIPPDKTLLPKLGLGGYSIPQAIAELIDNAIDAQLEGSRLHVDVSFDAAKIVVTDDGGGMNYAGLRNAMRLAFSQKEGKLGEFGLGLKTACTSLGRQFEVSSSTAGDAS